MLEIFFWKRIYKKTEIVVDILLEYNNLDFIREKEIEFIKLYGRRDLNLGTLVNLTDGGDGSAGYVPTQEAIKKTLEKTSHPVIRLLDNKVYTSVNQAARENKLHPSHLRYRLDLYDKTIGFVYKDKELDEKSKEKYLLLVEQQNYRKPKSTGSTSKYVGVHFDKQRRKWSASIWIEKKKVGLGRFDKEEDVAAAYLNRLEEYRKSKKEL